MAAIQFPNTFAESSKIRWTAFHHKFPNYYSAHAFDEVNVALTDGYVKLRSKLPEVNIRQHLEPIKEKFKEMMTRKEPIVKKKKKIPLPDQNVGRKMQEDLIKQVEENNKKNYILEYRDGTYVYKEYKRPEFEEQAQVLLQKTINNLFLRLKQKMPLKR